MGVVGVEGAKCVRRWFDRRERVERGNVVVAGVVVVGVGGVWCRGSERVRS